MYHYRKHLLAGCALLACVSSQALTVDALRTQYLTNPVGIDAESPMFSWQLQSDVRSTRQQSYKIEIGLDKNMSGIVYDSGDIASDKSVNVQLDGLALQPSTRYYWRVTVTDSHGATATSTPAYFETGLMGTGWSGARWICAGNGADTEDVASEVTDYVFEADFEIDRIAAGIIWGATDRNNYYMWQFNTEEATPRFRPHRWSNGNAACLENKMLDASELVNGHQYHMRVEVTDGGTRALTYLDGKLIDDRKGDFPYGSVGFRQAKSEHDSSIYERAFYDNVVMTAADGTVLYSEDFEDGANCSISGGTIVDGRMRVGEDHDVYAWSSTGDEDKFLRYDIDTDITLIQDAASIIFGYQKSNRYFMWAINTNDRGYPLVRRHVYANSSNPQFSDTRIEGLTNADVLGVEHHMRLEIDGQVVRTYLDDKLVDTFTDNTGLLSNGLIGFRVYKDVVNEQAYWDNVKVTVYDREGNKHVSVSEDFESDTYEFSSADVVSVGGNRKLHTVSKQFEAKVMQDAAFASPRFRKDFNLDGKVKSAKLYTSALGVYNVYINGQRVGSQQADGTTVYDELMPGWTDYRSTVFYMTHDVTPLMREGANALGATVSSGWWAGDVSHGIYGSTGVAFIGKLVVELESGEVVTVVTDPSWLTSGRGPIKSGEIYHGESYDARLADNWTAPGYDTALWNRAGIDRQSHGELIANEGPTVRVIPSLERKARTITVYEGTKDNGTAYGEINTVGEYAGTSSVTLRKGQTMVVDFGQNASGWAKFKVKGNAGTQLKLRYAEMVNDSGDTERGNDAAKGSLYTVALRSAKAAGQYTLCGDSEGEVYAPTSTFYGFRYCDMEASDDVEIEWITAETISTANEENSSMRVNDADVNQLYSNILWGQRSNFVSVPTDCPQRDERLGWTADTQVFSLAASYNAQVQGFYHKWMRDMRDGQLADGRYPNVAPFNWVEHGSAAWADAGIILPWNVYVMYGDKAIIEENYDSMERYMDWLSTQTDGRYKYAGSDTRYGDWLSFENTDKRFVSVCYYAYMADIMSRMSKALSETEGDVYDQKAEKYAELFSNIKEEFKTRYYSKNPRNKGLTVTSQCAQLLALKYNLFDDEEINDAIRATLRRKIENNGNKLSTGFLGTAVINQTLSENGMDDLAYALLLQHDCPSWLYSVDQGATTIWERWNSYTLDGGFSKSIEMNSFNHYAYGAVGEWMYRYMAGIAPDMENPGFGHIQLRPCFDPERRITDVDASFASNYGNVDVVLRNRADGTYSYAVTVPANATATLTLPLPAAGLAIFEGDKPAEEAEGVTDYATDGTNATMTLGSGTYDFSVAEDKYGALESAVVVPFRVYPNPATEEVKVQCDKSVTNIRIHSLAGVTVASADETDTINVASLPAAIYLLTVTDADGVQRTTRLIKQ